MMNKYFILRLIVTVQKNNHCAVSYFAHIMDVLLESFSVIDFKCVGDSKLCQFCLAYTKCVCEYGWI